jgi:hypothetical protein
MARWCASAEAAVMMRLRSTLLTLLLGGPWAVAQSPAVVGDIERLIVVDTPSRFAESAARIRAEMQPGGRYASIKEIDRSQVEARLSQMEVVIARAGPAHAMSHDQRLELLESKREIVELLRRYANNGTSCDTHPNIGCAFR